MTSNKRSYRQPVPILSPDTAERMARYEMRHTPEEFIRLFCNWNITQWPYVREGDTHD